jgi:hypothetical protein
MALVALGFVSLVIGVIGYDRQQTVLEVGGLKATATEHNTVPYAPILGMIAVAGGVALLISDKRTGQRGRRELGA